MGGEAAQAAGGIPGINEGETVLSFPQQVVGRVVGEFQLAFAAGTLGVQLFDAGADQAVEAVPDEARGLRWYLSAGKNQKNPLGAFAARCALFHGKVHIRSIMRF